MKVLLTQVKEPQICFPTENGILCNWVRRGLYAISSKDGWMRIPLEEPDREKDEEEVEEKEEAPSLAATGASSEN